MTDIINVESTAIGVRTADTIATEINTIKRQTQKIMLASSIEIGKRLTEAKDMIDHGAWGKWLQDNVNYSERTAQNLMRVYDQYGDKFGMTEMDSLFASGAPNVFEELSYTQALALLSLPTDAEREEFVKENDVASMSTRELQEAIKARKEAEDRAMDAEKRAWEAKEKLRQAENRALQAENKARHAEQSDLYDERLTAAERERDVLQKRVLELEARPEISNAGQEEIEKLKKKISVLEAVSTDEDRMKFTAHMKIIQNAFNAMLSDIENITDNEKRTRYMSAAQKMLEKLGEFL
ncbi:MULTISPECIES: DUF3102 domain-containing protein [unclassified Megasphaera]|uniref:DUF3102 domain-containing protein n=1 Tax=unclassified Megasphaera TaxID=2626256 RepID=UPI000ECC6B18|nr:DUF3102 domain-containing protein [Megasphaera sp. UBA4233]HAM04559.1 hypothetical protein [Megasphaera sp.]